VFAFLWQRELVSCTQTPQCEEGEIRPQDALRLAAEYHAAAQIMRDRVRKGDALSQASFHFLALHSVELYLNALLLTFGHSAKDIRKLQHDFAGRCIAAGRTPLRLSQGTLSDLVRTTSAGEYRSRRYDTACVKVSELNRREQTLREVAQKVTELVCPSQQPANAKSQAPALRVLRPGPPPNGTAPLPLRAGAAALP
jgi:hypothetical protein